MNGNETIEQKKRRLVGKINYLGNYLEILSRFLKRKVKAIELLSIIETDRIVESTKYFAMTPYAYSSIFNLEKESDDIKQKVQKHVLEWNVPFTIFISGYSLWCGLMQIPTLDCFDWSFSFKNTNELISFTSLDGKEYILMDFFEENSTQFVEIKIKFETKPN